jgi:hypothetical protein
MFSSIDRTTAPTVVAENKLGAGTTPGLSDSAAGQRIRAPAQQGWLPHHAASQAHAAHWVALTHRAAPQASMGVRAGTLVPPRGAVVSHSPAHSATVAAAKSAARGTKANARMDIDGDGANGADGEVSFHTLQIGSADVAVGGSGHSGSGMGSDAGGGDGTVASWWQPAVDRADGAAEAGPAANAVESAAQVAARLQSGQTCWVASFRLAMECAQCHPGTDIFVQAFNIVDADGCVIPAFSRRARLRAGESGSVQLRSDDARGSQPPSSVHEQDALIQELSSAPLLALSLRPVVDESGAPVSALDGLAPAELSQLRRLFERPLPAALREALAAAMASQCERWRWAREREDFEERMARHGDALERELNERRARLSTTLDAGGMNAHRANANWLRAQAQVRHWAERGELPTWRATCRINALLGEGLKPWNRAEQADRIGARFGELRRVDVVAGTPPHYFLRADQLGLAVDELFRWLDEQQRYETPVLLVAAQLHQRVVSLHPFVDANGRTARLLVDWLLTGAGMPPPLLRPKQLALFANEVEARQAAPGLAERSLIEGVCGSVNLHLEWLGFDDPAA